VGWNKPFLLGFSTVFDGFNTTKIFLKKLLHGSPTLIFFISRRDASDDDGESRLTEVARNQKLSENKNSNLTGRVESENSAVSIFFH
jgi:hypothetical protein